MEEKDSLRMERLTVNSEVLIGWDLGEVLRIDEFG